MREVITMWKYTRMVVLVALTAALYAAVLIPFKLLPLIPGITELRPANVLPVICSLMFGPAAAWGSAFGNLIGDLLGGTSGLGSYFGMLGNFWYGYFPYRAWRTLSSSDPIPWSAGRLARYFIVSLLASLACAVQISWGLDMLGFVPFHILGPLIGLNNFVTASLLGPLLLPILYPRIKRWGLLYTDVMETEDLWGGRLPYLAHLFLWGAVLGGLILGIVISLGVTESQTFTLNLPGGAHWSLSLSDIPRWGTSVGTSLMPLIGLLVVGALLL
ncbi:MAG: QueT transporter family protein [Candidatus Latescibacteria bacterium]|nr:QueT transporter family protein [Candidatus Latescibacterota bacterium]